MSVATLYRGRGSRSRPCFSMTSTPAANLIVRTDFEAICPTLTADEFQGLREDIRAHGCTDPIVVWKGHGVVLDGHNRFRICETDNLPYCVAYVELEDETAAKRWILRRQRNRRNLDRTAIKRLMAAEYELEKGQGERTDLTSRQTGEKSTAAERVAERYGTSPRTVERNAQFHRDVKDITVSVGPRFSEMVEQREIDLTKAEFHELASNVREKAKEGKRVTPEDVLTFNAERAELKATQEPPPAECDLPYVQKTVTGFDTYESDGKTYIRAAKLHCGHLFPYERVQELDPAKTGSKSRPCYACGSGTRVPAERRRDDYRFAKAFRTVVGAEEDAVAALTRAAIRLTGFRHTDSRVQALVDEIATQARKAGLMEAA